MHLEIAGADARQLLHTQPLWLTVLSGPLEL